MIEVKEIHKGFSGEPILKGITTSFERGKTNLIIGTSGSGKTVFLKCLLGLFTPEKGSIVYDGVSYEALSIEKKTSVTTANGHGFPGQCFI